MKIKTRESLRDIRVFDKTKDLSERTRSGIGELSKNTEDLANMITVLRGKITSAEAQLEALKQEDAAQKAVSESIIPAYRQFKTWAEEFDSAPWEMKKMIANQLFSKVEIGKGYKIRLELDATFKTFCEDWISLQTLEAAV